MGSQQSLVESPETSNYRKHTHSNPLQRRLIDKFHHAISARVGGLAPRTFLDAGCGEGFVSEHLLQCLPSLELTGFDMNPDCVAAASLRNPSASFLVGSVTDIPFKDNAFEVVGCFEVLEHLTNPEVALNELLRVASTAIVLSVPREPYFSLANVARGKNLDIRPRGSDPDHRQFWSHAAFRTFVEDHARIEWIGTSLPWTICVAQSR